MRYFLALVCLMFVIAAGCDRHDSSKPWTYHQIDTNAAMSTNVIAVNDGSVNRSMEARYSIGQFMGKTNGLPVGRTITAVQLYEITRNAGVPPSAIAILADDKYVMPTSDWVSQDLWGGVREFMFQHGTLRYATGVNDCDDQARQIVTYAQIANANNPVVSGLPLAVGEFWYKKDKPQGNHAVVLCVVKDEGRLKLKFVEIDGTDTNLTEEEIRSCFMFRF